MPYILDRGLAYAELLRLRQKYRKYKEAYWDAEHNHIRAEYAEGLYQIFHEGVTARQLWNECERRKDLPNERHLQIDVFQVAN